MNFLTGIYAIQANAAALNNGEGEETTARVKTIRVQQREYPYVSAQAVRFWLRETLQRYDSGWQAAPIYRGKGSKQQAYTEGNPIRYWDDDLFGYMRAEKDQTVTRVSPFRLSTLIAAAPAEIVTDFGVMARMEGNPVLHEHEFYRTPLVGAFSLDLGMAGTFTSKERTGYLNLSKEQKKEAEARGLEYVSELDAYRLPVEERIQRIASLLRAFGRLEGGAKQTLHLTDVSPMFVCMAVLKGGNNPFINLLLPQPQPALNVAALDEALHVYGGDFISPVVIGLRQGFMDSAYAPLAERGLRVVHPRQALDELANLLRDHPEWLV